MRFPTLILAVSSTLLFLSGTPSPAATSTTTMDQTSLVAIHHNGMVILVSPTAATWHILVHGDTLHTDRCPDGSVPPCET